MRIPTTTEMAEYERSVRAEALAGRFFLSVTRKPEPFCERCGELEAHCQCRECHAGNARSSRQAANAHRNEGARP